MNKLDVLTEYFRKFPGIGPRQARRFALFLLASGEDFRKRISESIADISTYVRQCGDCQRFFSTERNDILCALCESKTRDSSMLMLVERDTDLDAIEKSGAYRGRYFVLGGSIPVISDDAKAHIRTGELELLLSRRTDIREVILALSATPHGEHTSLYLIGMLTKRGLPITKLGRGLSSGVELEYIDADTMRDAFSSRK